MLRVYESPSGLLIAFAANWERRLPEHFDNAKVLARLPMTGKASLKVVRSMVDYYRSQGHEVVWPALKGLFHAKNLEGDVLATGTYTEVAEAVGVDLRAVYRSQVLLHQTVRSPVLRIQVKFEPGRLLMG